MKNGSWPRAVLFDLDGTLIDSAPDIHAAVNELLGRRDRCDGVELKKPEPSHGVEHAARRPIEHLRARNQELLRLLQAKEARRDTLRDQALAEAEGLGGTRIRGQGPVYTQRRTEFERYQHELGTFRQQASGPSSQVTVTAPA